MTTPSRWATKNIHWFRGTLLMLIWAIPTEAWAEFQNSSMKTSQHVLKLSVRACESTLEQRRAHVEKHYWHPSFDTAKLIGDSSVRIKAYILEDVDALIWKARDEEYLFRGESRVVNETRDLQMNVTKEQCEKELVGRTGYFTTIQPYCDVIPASSITCIVGLPLATFEYEDIPRIDCDLSTLVASGECAPVGVPIPQVTETWPRPTEQQYKRILVQACNDTTAMRRAFAARATWLHESVRSTVKEMYSSLLIGILKADLEFATWISGGRQYRMRAGEQPVADLWVEYHTHESPESCDKELAGKTLNYWTLLKNCDVPEPDFNCGVPKNLAARFWYENMPKFDCSLDSMLHYGTCH